MLKEIHLPKGSKSKVLFLESGLNKGRNPRSNLALSRFSAYFKDKCEISRYVIGRDLQPLFIPDVVIASITFSWDVSRVIESIMAFKRYNPELVIYMG